MNTFLCLATNTVISEEDLRYTRRYKFRLSRDIENWSEKVYLVGNMRRIYNVPMPEGEGWIPGFEEREDGLLYQTWSSPP